MDSAQLRLQYFELVCFSCRPAGIDSSIVPAVCWPDCMTSLVALLSLVGWHAKRFEFEPEWDNDAEAAIAEIEFRETDTPEEEAAKLKLLEIYNKRLNEVCLQRVVNTLQPLYANHTTRLCDYLTGCRHPHTPHTELLLTSSHCVCS
jgi:hypothetical protein